MVGMHGFHPPQAVLDGRVHFLHMAVLYAIVWGCPNVLQIMRRYAPVIGEVDARRPWFIWSPGFGTALAVGCAAAIATFALGGTTEFLYFQF
jgi:hypothetical protein